MTLNSYQISQILDQLLSPSSGYDRQIRPQITGPPLEVEVDFIFWINLQVEVLFFFDLAALLHFQNECGNMSCRTKRQMSCQQQCTKQSMNNKLLIFSVSFMFFQIL